MRHVWRGNSSLQDAIVRHKFRIVNKNIYKETSRKINIHRNSVLNVHLHDLSHAMTESYDESTFIF